MCIRLTALQQAFKEVQITMTTLGLYVRGLYIYIYIYSSKGVMACVRIMRADGSLPRGTYKLE